MNVFGCFHQNDYCSFYFLLLFLWWFDYDHDDDNDDDVNDEVDECFIGYQSLSVPAYVCVCEPNLGFVHTLSPLWKDLM
jgi:hypothetical protein